MKLAIHKSIGRKRRRRHTMIASRTPHYKRRALFFWLCGLEAQRERFFTMWTTAAAAAIADLVSQV